MTNDYSISKLWKESILLMHLYPLFLYTGELDHLPEVAFYMVGPIEEVTQKAERLAEER